MDNVFTRRDMLTRCGAGFGMIGLANVLAADAPAPNPLAPRPPHFAAKAKHIIHVYMNGGPSQVDTFESQAGSRALCRPAAGQHCGLSHREHHVGLKPSPFKFPHCGQSGLQISEIFPNIAKFATTFASSVRCTPTFPITSRRCS